MLAVARRAPMPTVAAAIRQSAWCRVTPCSAYSRRHVPARMPSAAPRGAWRKPENSLRAAGSSPGRRPRQISSTEMAHTQGSVPVRRSDPRRAPACRPLRASISTVESSSSREIVQPALRASPWRWLLTQAAGSMSHSCPLSDIPPRADSISSHRRSSSRPRLINSAMKALRFPAPARRSNWATSSSSKAMCMRMGLP